MRTRAERLSSNDVLTLLASQRSWPLDRSLKLDPMRIVGLVTEASWNVSYYLLRDRLLARDYSFRRLRAYRLRTLPALVVLESTFERDQLGARLLYVECAGYHAAAARVDEDITVVVGGDVVSLGESTGGPGLLANSSFSLGPSGVELLAGG